MFTGILAVILVGTTVFCVKQLITLYGAKASAVAVQGEDSNGGTENAASVMNDNVVEKMEAIEQIIDYYYYQEEIDEAALEDGIYKGMIDSLGDPYSTYYSEEELADIMEQTEGIYYGIGAYISLDLATGLGKISGVITGTPAEAANLREGPDLYG